ncbi:MAG: glycosyl transferase [Leptospira sp.]|nr:glycosyl transferase [Leptospira sp.]
MNIYYYASGHGFGHISRTSVILKELLNQKEISEVHLISSRVQFIDWSHPKLIKRELNLDVGVFQKDSLSLDITKTKESLQEFEKIKNSLLQTEAKYCRKNKIQLILTDAASLPLVLAVEVGIPSIFIGNFTWDFIYQNYAKDDPYFSVISDIYRTEYSFATEGLFLPFTCPMPPFLEFSNVGLVGRKPNLSKNEARKSFGFQKDKKYILLSFGAYGLSGFEMKWEKLSKEIQLVAYGVPGLDLKHVISPENCYYPDLVTACDYVLTKPGYGILSECYLANTPILYTDRGDFAEFPFLVQSLQKYFHSAYMSHSDISDCNFENVISGIDNSNSISKILDIRISGEIDIVKHILEYNF